MVAIDAKRRHGDDLAARGPGWDVYTHGGRKNTGLDAVAWARRWPSTAPARSCSPAWTATAPRSASTSSSPAPSATRCGVPVIASGGVGALEHLSEGIRIGGADAVLAASIFHYGEFTVGQAKALLARDGIPVRL